MLLLYATLLCLLWCTNGMQGPHTSAHQMRKPCDQAFLSRLHVEGCVKIIAMCGLSMYHLQVLDNNSQDDAEKIKSIDMIM